MVRWATLRFRIVGDVCPRIALFSAAPSSELNGMTCSRHANEEFAGRSGPNQDSS